MSWGQRLKRVFRIDIETCRRCGGRVKVISSIEDPGVIKQILDHLDRRAGLSPAGLELPLADSLFPQARTPCLAGHRHGPSRAHLLPAQFSPTKVPLEAPISELPIAVATKFRLEGNRRLGSPLIT
jgi:hypothetical protein